jgi:hypothetical protein
MRFALEKAGGLVIIKEGEIKEQGYPVYYVVAEKPRNSNGTTFVSAGAISEEMGVGAGTVPSPKPDLSPPGTPVLAAAPPAPAAGSAGEVSSFEPDSTAARAFGEAL